MNQNIKKVISNNKNNLNNKNNSNNLNNNIKKVMNNNKNNIKNAMNNNKNNISINNTITNIKNKSLSNKIRVNKSKIIFILAVILLIVIIGLLGYYIYKKYPEMLPFFKEKTDEEKIQNNLNKLSEQENVNNGLQEKQNSRERERRADKSNMANLLNNVKDKTYKKTLNNKKQVFNISNNIFSYNEAEAACKAHGAELASYEQVADAYKEGAEWCNYGWAKNQMALYPTQKKTWDKLQEDPESANDCGEWGVNGGYFENKDTLFGANCYGIKPEPKDRERTRAVPVSMSQRNILDKIKMFKDNKNSFTVNPFNNDLWSQK
jgi:hypothetical protein